MEDSNWKNDDALEQGLRDYMPKNLKMKEILDFMKCDCEQYCIATLDRSLRFLISTI